MRRAIPPRVSAPKWLVQAGSDSWRNWTPCNANRRISHACPTRPGWAQVFLSVPDLTRRAGIKLNDRVWLRGCSERVFVSHRTISPKRPGPPLPEPSSDHIPLGGFVNFGSLRPAIALAHKQISHRSILSGAVALALSA